MGGLRAFAGQGETETGALWEVGGGEGTACLLISPRGPRGHRKRNHP